MSFPSAAGTFRSRLPSLPPGLRRSYHRFTATRFGMAAAWTVLALVAWGILAKVLAHGAPTGIMMQGLVLGAINALLALSIVLIYRANRVVNFAAADIGGVAAVVAIELHLKLGWNYFLSLGAGLVLAALIGGAVEALVLRRFTNAPRFIVMVVTIGLAEIFNAASVIIPVLWSSGNNQGSFNTPFTFHFRIFPVLFNGNYVVAMVAVPVVMLLLIGFLRYTNYGTAIRAAADNGDRARLLGIPVKRLSTLVWMMAGVMSALAALLRVPIQGFASFSSVSSSGPTLLFETLTAAVIASMTSMPVAVVAAMGLGLIDSLGAWTYQNAAYVYLTQLVIVLLALMIKRDKLTRAADAGISTWQAIKQVRPTPPELASRPAVRLGSSGFRLAILAFALCIPLFETPARTHLSAIVLLYSVIAVSLVVLTAWGGQISLGHIAFMGFGAAVAGTLLGHGWNTFLAVAVAMAVTTLLAVLLGMPALRLGSNSPYLAVVTLGLAVTANGYFFLSSYFPWLIPTNAVPQNPLFGRLSVTSDSQLYYMCLVVLILTVVAVRALRNSHAGRAMIAANDNRQATQSFGISTVRVQLMSFAVSGALAGLAGAFYVILEAGFNAGDFDPQSGINFFLMVVIGGLGSIPGAILGAIYVFGAQYLLPADYGILATGIGVVVVLMFFPGGLGELAFRGRDTLLRLYASRRGLYVPSLLADRRIDDVGSAPAAPSDATIGDAAAVTAVGPGGQPLAVDPQALAERELAGAGR